MTALDTIIVMIFLAGNPFLYPAIWCVETTTTLVHTHGAADRQVCYVCEKKKAGHYAIPRSI